MQKVFSRLLAIYKKQLFCSGDFFKKIVLRLEQVNPLEAFNEVSIFGCQIM